MTCSASDSPEDRHASAAERDAKDARYKQHILHRCQLIAEAVKCGEQGIRSLDTLESAACRTWLIEISHASESLSAHFRDQYPDIPWRLIKDTRNVMAHAYDHINTRTLWNTITIFVPQLAGALTSPTDE